jgi:hypothetical protein
MIKALGIAFSIAVMKMVSFFYGFSSFVEPKSNQIALLTNLEASVRVLIRSTFSSGLGAS